MDSLTTDTVKIGRLYSKIVFYIMLICAIIIGIFGLMTFYGDNDYYYVNGVYSGKNIVRYTIINVNYEKELKYYGDLDKIYNIGDTIKLQVPISKPDQPEIYISPFMFLVLVIVILLIGYIPYVLAQNSEFFAVVMSLQLVKGVFL